MVHFKPLAPPPPLSPSRTGELIPLCACHIYVCYFGVRGAAEEQLAERQRLTVTSTDQRPLAMRSVHFPFDCDAFLEMIPKLNQEIYIV